MLAQIEEARLEQAQLFGFASYDEFVLRRRMVESPAHAAKFLDDVRAAVADDDQHRCDVEPVRQAKAAPPGPVAVDATRSFSTGTRCSIPSGSCTIAGRSTTRRSAPISRRRKAFASSCEWPRRCTASHATTRWTIAAVSAPDVEAWAVTDVASNRKIATLYVDPYSRDGKYNHAAVWNYRNGATSVPRQAQSALVVNFDRRGLSLRELETLMHEFGHTLRNNLSATRYASDAGENVAQDFAEAPSEMLENWVYDKKVLKLFQEVCASCKPVPDDLVDKARAARDFGKGLQIARQHLFASYDLALHGPAAPDPMETWQKMEAATTLGHVPGTSFPSGFSHIAGGYGAGYYGYLWSQAVAADMRTAFLGDKLDPKVGARFRSDGARRGRGEAAARDRQGFPGARRRARRRSSSTAEEVAAGSRGGGSGRAQPPRPCECPPTKFSASNAETTSPRR